MTSQEKTQVRHWAELVADAFGARVSEDVPEIVLMVREARARLGIPEPEGRLYGRAHLDEFIRQAKAANEAEYQALLASPEPHYVAGMHSGGRNG